MTYPEARAYIEALGKRGWRLGLDRMQEFLHRIGDPHVGQKFFHVAGTNGKGSVTAMIASVLKLAGYRTGSYFSPYVYDFRERIQVNGEMIPEEDVARLTEFLMPISEELALTDFGGPTEFEFKTAMGFLYWKEQKCDYVALETGLGGRLDATNVVTPIVSVITEIGLDHQEHLGNTIEEIAREKAGIIKPGAPVVIGVTDPQAGSVIAETARSMDSPLDSIYRTEPFLGCILNPPVYGPGTNLIGEHQRRNAQLAERALRAAGLDIPPPVFQEGLLSVNIPGRLEIVSREPLIIFDGAHNAQAMRAVVRAVREGFRTSLARVVYSAASGHNPQETLAELEPFAAKIYAAPMKHPRGLPLEELARYVQGIHPSVAAALQSANDELQGNEYILVTGSFYLLAEAKEALSRLNP